MTIGTPKGGTGAAALFAASLAMAAVLTLAPVGTGAAAASDRTIGKVGGLKYRLDTGHITASGNEAKASLEGVRCGRGWRATGGGIQLGGAAANAYIDETFPVRPPPPGARTRSRRGFSEPRYFTPKGWVGRGWHANAPRRELGVYVICERRDDLLFTSMIGGFDQGAGFASAPCQGGRWHVTGGGADIGPLAVIGDQPPDPFGDHFINSTFPNDGGDDDSVTDDSWDSWQYDEPGGGSMVALSFAVCRKGGLPAYKLKESANAAAGETVAAKARCGRGRHVFGGGAAVGGAVSEAHLVSSRPIDGGDRDEIPDDGWRARARNDSGSDKDLRVFAICKR